MTRHKKPSTAQPLLLTIPDKGVRNMSKETQTIKPLLLNMAQASQVLCLGKSKIYELMEAEGLPHTKIGRSLRFPYAALQHWVEQRSQKGAA